MMAGNACLPGGIFSFLQSLFGRMDQSGKKPTNSRHLAVFVRGVVQGVGFRPFVYQLARSHKLGGWVRNEADTVCIDVQGDSAAVEAFLVALRTAPPPQARIERLEVQDLPHLADLPAQFEIRPSQGRSMPRPVIPADLAACAECQAEIFDPAQRRHLYPFTNCTNCGPRWSIIERLPYDRPQTAMKSFTMCPACRAEYENPADRRFHAQPIACPRCGPHLELVDPQGRRRAGEQSALEAAVQALLTGRILALKGLGGFQILVDATNADAIDRLRARKRRPHRPFAIMCCALDEVRRHCRVSPDEAQVLTSPQSPIVLLLRSDNLSISTLHPSFPLPDVLAPGNPHLGVMLPYTPLHHLLLHFMSRPVVCTSGNLSEEPMAIDNAEALERLGPMVDLLLWHDRPIVRPVDDSVVRLGPAGLQILRRARGYAPLPLSLDFPAPPLLALGGHLKNTVAVSLGSSSVRETHPSEAESPIHETPSTPAVLSSHIGDLDHPLSVEVFRRAAEDLREFYQVRPEAIVCDLHPDYASTHEAEALARKWKSPCIRVQHHHAHVAACMAEHALDGPVLGLAWDGTGYGPDGTIWGGEYLVCERGNFHRAAHWRTFPLPGGDRAVREPRRSALGVLFEISPQLAAETAHGWFSPGELITLLKMLERKSNCPRTSSVGRLFDAVAALCGLPAVITFEGQSAMALEFTADYSEMGRVPNPSDNVPSLVGQVVNLSYPVGQVDNLPEESPLLRPRLPMNRSAVNNPANSAGTAVLAVESGSLATPESIILDWEPLIHSILADRAAGVPVSTISARFHQTLVQGAVEIAQRVALPRVVLTGGCFQNALLTAKMIAALQNAGFSVYTHRQVPPGDGGIALGQLYVAAREYNKK
jgi:hydrogenase maturation protein HypF